MYFAAECNCHGKAVECVYNATVDAMSLSVNMEGKYSGGGVCLNCQVYHYFFFIILSEKKEKQNIAKEQRNTDQ
jgi:hypothetical protein